MRPSVGNISSCKSFLIVISVVLCLGLRSIEPVEAVHPWVSSTTASPTTQRRFSPNGPLAALPASSKTKKPKGGEKQKVEPTARKRRSFFSRPSSSPKESEDPEEPDSGTTRKVQNRSKKPSWKEVRIPKKDENTKKKRSRFRFGNGSSEEEKDKNNPETESRSVMQDSKETEAK